MPRFPDEISVTDVADEGTPEGANTPAGEPSGDFFSSWDKPVIKRPSNPPSRTGTPANASRTASPFLNAGANGNGTTRSKSPLNASSAPSPDDSKPAVSRAIPSTAIRKTGTAQPRKTNVLGAKKKGLGAKKIGGDVAATIDFDEAERKAREEEERIAKLGYDPEAEAAEASATPSSPKAAAATESTIVSPTPLSPGRTFGATKGHERSSSEVERLGMGIGRLGFGQVGGQKAATAPKKPGFGAVARAAPVEGTILPLITSYTLSKYRGMLTVQRRLGALRPREIRLAKRHFLRRVLQPRRLRSQRPSRS